MTRKSLYWRGILVLLFILVSLAATMFLDLKYHALKFNNRDAAFYLQFAAKLFDPQLPRRFTINPDGFNYLGFAGTEGAAGFHQSIHFEPIRYFSAAAYALTRTPISLFAFYAVLYFLPILYIAFVNPVKRPSDHLFFLLFILLYILFPLTLSSVADDLRPRSLMVPALLLTFFAIHWQRGIVEKLTFFGLLLFTREEAVILAAGLIPYEFIRARIAGRKNFVAFLFTALWLAWIWLQYRFFLWTGYSISQDLSLKSLVFNIFGQPIWIVAAVIGLVGLVFLFRAQIRRFFRHPEAIGTSVYLFLVLPPLVVQTIREELHWFQAAPFLIGFVATVNDLFFLSKNALLFVAVLLLMLQVWDGIRSERRQNSFLIGITVVLLLSSIIGINQVVMDVREYQQASASTGILFNLRSSTNHLTTPILADYSTNMVFYDYDKLYVFERLPYDVLAGEARFYPNNLSVLRNLIDQQVEWVAIGTANKNQVLALLKEENIKPRILAENETYVVMRLR